MKHQHWYLRSWEYENQLQSDGTIRRELVYKGEYYRVARGNVPLWILKAVPVLLTVVLWVMLACMLTHFSRGATLFFVGGPCAVTLIPAIYLAIGSIRAAMVPENMTFRDLCGSRNRIRTASKWILVLMAICTAGELFYLVFRVVNGYPVAWGQESLWLAGAIVGVAVPAVCLGLGRRFPIELLPAGTGPGKN